MYTKAQIKTKQLLKTCINTLKFIPLSTYNYDKMIVPVRFQKGCFNNIIATISL